MLRTMGPALNHLAVPVDDLERATTFYADLFDAQVVPSPRFPVPVAWVVLGSVQLHLVERPGSTTTAYHFGVTIEDRDRFEELYHRAGRDGLYEREAMDHHLYEAPGGVVQLYLRDPSGNLVECDYPDVADLDARIAAQIRRWADLNDQSSWNASASVFDTGAA
jgi:catechol 2,3-dioxygenase-like lactoylglutathione lyase family enzyme